VRKSEHQRVPGGKKIQNKKKTENRKKRKSEEKSEKEKRNRTATPMPYYQGNSKVRPRVRQEKTQCKNYTKEKKFLPPGGKDSEKEKE